jgi:hypothetical protein
MPQEFKLPEWLGEDSKIVLAEETKAAVRSQNLRLEINHISRQPIRRFNCYIGALRGKIMINVGSDDAHV